MRIWLSLAFTAALSVFYAPVVSAQVTVSNMFGVPVFVTNFAKPNLSTTLTPNLATSNATPAIGQQSVTPTATSPNVPAIPKGPGSASATQPFTTGIGQQGSGTTIGQQGSTAIGQQGVGTAIMPQTNGIVIGQPEPFNPPAQAKVPAQGAGTNVQNRLGQTVPLPGGGFTNVPASTPTPNAPATTQNQQATPRPLTPTGRR
jgi:hypothetical protein